MVIRLQAAESLLSVGKANVVLIDGLLQPRAKTYNLGDGAFAAALFAYEDIDLVEFYVNIFYGSNIFYD